MQHHSIGASYDADRSITLNDDIPGGAENGPFSNVSGKVMATCFAHAALKAFNSSKILSVARILAEGSDTSSPVTQEQLHKEIDNKVLEFYAD